MVGLKKIGNTKSRFRKRFSPSLKSKIAQLVNEGEKKSNILDALHITGSTLSQWINKFSDIQKHSSFKELTVQNSNIIEKNQVFTIETPSGFQIKLGSQQELVSIIRALEAF